ncbi:hypothetical protein [Pseudoroseomonas cervicalis]|uniref:hypothetical protein n=1 Tax=Teichococcus cervicalis TaxID=204525 RepID=UPI0022F1D87C|nr:hypothetical protein [Pseudoroseomonas cervicalis]WBV41461.1 hypothetical protein PFY06_09355 [Pseudoroseomonas cervicalis]
MDHTASILAFPGQPQDRLRLALRKLETALAEQAEAVALFRSNLQELKSATNGLAHQVHRYHDTLGETAVKVRHAHDAARALERTAEKMAALG